MSEFTLDQEYWYTSNYIDGFTVKTRRNYYTLQKGLTIRYAPRDTGAVVATLTTLPILTNKYTINNNTIQFNSPLYMYGTRKQSNYLIDGVDIGYYYQYNTTTPAIVVGGVSTGTWGTMNTVFTNAYWIWNAENTAVSAVTNEQLYFYHTFFNSGSPYTGRCYIAVDNIGTFTFNNIFIGNCNGGYGNNSQGFIFDVNVVTGLNYIKISGLNAGTANNPAGCIFAMTKSGINIINSGADWYVKTNTNPDYTEIVSNTEIGTGITEVYGLDRGLYI